ERSGAAGGAAGPNSLGRVGRVTSDHSGEAPAPRLSSTAQKGAGEGGQVKIRRPGRAGNAAGPGGGGGTQPAAGPEGSPATKGLGERQPGDEQQPGEGQGEPPRAGYPEGCDRSEYLGGHRIYLLFGGRRTAIDSVHEPGRRPPPGS